MIIDIIENLDLYEDLNERFPKAIEFILNTDLEAIEPGRHVIQGDEIFANVDEYESKDPDDCLLEAHKRYIDIQVMISGEEFVGTAGLDGQVPAVDYDEQKDVAFYKEKYETHLFKPGMMAIFQPKDLHMPGLMTTQKTKIKKMVVKVLK